MHPQTQVFCLVRTAHESDVDLALGGEGKWIPVNDLDGQPINTGKIALYPCPELAEQMAAALQEQGFKPLQVRRVWWPVSEVSRAALAQWFEEIYPMRKNHADSRDSQGTS